MLSTRSAKRHGRPRQRGQRHRETCEFSGLQVRGLDAVVGMLNAGSGDVADRSLRRLQPSVIGRVVDLPTTCAASASRAGWLTTPASAARMSRDRAWNGVDPCLVDGGVHAFVDRVERAAQFRQARDFGLCVGFGHGLVERCLQFGQDEPLVGAAAVEFEADRAKPDAAQAGVDHVEGGHLLRDEQDRLPVMHCTGDDVGNRLRLAGAGRTLHHEVAARANGLDDDRL